MSTNLRRPDYHRHLWKRGEKACTAALCAAAVGLLAYFFYRSLLAVVPLSAVGVLLFFRIGKEKGKKDREELAIQFRECILAVSTSLQAGYSAENAFMECRQDMALMYGEGGFMVREMDIIRRGLTINIPLEELLAVPREPVLSADDMGRLGQLIWRSAVAAMKSDSSPRSFPLPRETGEIWRRSSEAPRTRSEDRSG